MTVCFDGDHEAPQQAIIRGILEQPGAGARALIRGSNHASAFFDEATASDFAAIELATQGMYVRRIDHDGIVSVAAR